MSRSVEPVGVAPMLEQSIYLPAACIATTALAFMHAEAAALCTAVLAAVFLFRVAIRQIGDLSSFTVVFVGFHCIYGLAGPTSAVLGFDPLVPVFTMPFETSAFLQAFGLATLGLSLALLATTQWRGTAHTRNLPSADFSSLQPEDLAYTAVGVAALASLCECVNVMRSGGVSALALGKAIFQSVETSIGLTLPSERIAAVAVAFATLAVALQRERSVEGHSTRPPISKMVWVAFVCMLMPVTTVYLLLGRRGPLLAWVFAAIVGLRFWQPVRRLSRKTLWVLASVYLGMVLIFAQRYAIGYAAATGDFSLIAQVATNPEFVEAALNPSNNEFGAAFGNYSEFVKYNDEDPLLGRTYVEGLVLPIPSFLYPGQKPKQITYAFRDQFFPSIAYEGAIAGTAYSSILEAYANFRLAGVFVIYFLIGLILVWVEGARKGASLLAAVIYVITLPLAIEFHRDAFGDVFSALAVDVVVSIPCVFFVIAAPRYVRQAMLRQRALT